MTEHRCIAPLWDGDLCGEPAPYQRLVRVGDRTVIAHLCSVHAAELDAERREEGEVAECHRCGKRREIVARQIDRAIVRGDEHLALYRGLGSQWCAECDTEAEVRS